MPPTNSSIWDQDIPVPASVLDNVDPAVLRLLPEGTKATAIAPSGSSYWARTGRIDTIDGSTGEPAAYFIKVMQGETGKGTVSGEFRSMSTMHSIMPTLVARPVGWGAYDSVPDTFFQITEFREMSDGLPDAAQVVPMLAELHRRSAALPFPRPGLGAGDKFGINYPAFGGNKVLGMRASQTWEECFSRGLRHEFASETAVQGLDPELEALRATTLEKVVPRLLRPMETGGRSVKPAFCHGDLWEGNIDLEPGTGRPVIYDATPLWAHNEFELAPWTVERHSVTLPYIKEYLKYWPAAEPVEDFEDRLVLYRLHWETHGSSLYRGKLMMRGITKKLMAGLIAKHGDGYEGWLAKQEQAKAEEAEEEQGEYVLVGGDSGPSLVAASRDTGAAKLAEVAVSEVPPSPVVVQGLENKTTA